MNLGIFESNSYKTYLRTHADVQGRGEKSRIAEALKCHLTYVSQVILGEAHFSLEQADALTTYLGLSEDEAEYFLLLVSHERAGTLNLRARYAAKLKQIVRTRAKLESRLKNMKMLGDDSQTTYYSAWFYSAIHLLITIPEFQTKEKIAQHLGLSLLQVGKVLDFFLATGLAALVDGKYRAGQVMIHLQNDSPLIARHHASWRIQATRAIEQQQASNFHYTSVISMSEEDAVRVRKTVVDVIEQAHAIIRTSPEKAAFCFAIDLFGV